MIAGTGPTVSRCHTSDPDVARAHTSRAFSEHDVQLKRSRDFDFYLDVARSEQLTVGRLGYAADTMIDGPAMGSCYHLNLPITGSCTAAQRGDRQSFGAGERGVLFQPDQPFSVRLSDNSWSYHVKLATGLVERQAAKLIGQPGRVSVDFEVTFALDACGSLVETVGWFFDEFVRPEGLCSLEQARHQFESAIATHLLLRVPSQLQRDLSAMPRHSPRSKIVELIAYLDEHVDPELTPADLATMAGMGIRSLRASFQDVTGQSPATYLRNLRLDRVRDAIQAGDSVTDAATRWGFYHLGRFAAYYRDRFGVLPSRSRPAPNRDRT